MEPYNNLDVMLALPENQDIVLVIRDSQSPATTELLTWELMRTAWAGRAPEVPAAFAVDGEFLNLQTDTEYLYVRAASRWHRLPFESSEWADTYNRLLRPVLPSLGSAPVGAPNGHGYYDTGLGAVRFKQGDSYVSLQPPQAFKTFTDGTVTLNADETGTLKFRSSDGSVLLTLTNNDITHGDNLNIRVDPSTINVGDFVDDLTYALAGHNHTGVYSPVGHNHDGTYAALVHNHDGVYSPVGHNHDGVYALISHAHAAGDVTSGTFTDARIAASNVTQHQAAINHNALLNYEANRHIDHSAVSILTAAGSGLTGGGTLESSRSLSLDINGITETVVVDLANDYFVIYDASAGANRKVHPSYFGFDLSSHSHTAAQIVSGVLAAERGGLGANASAFNGLVKMVGGVASVAVAGTDYAAVSHTQLAASISDFAAAVAATASVSANTAARHTQNTDTGTTSEYFQLSTGSSGGRVYWNAGSSEFRLRNFDNTDYAALRVKELYVEGTQTIINSNEVNIGDSVILLNSDITTQASNSDGGVDVKLLDADNTTRRDVGIRYNVSTRRWTASGFKATTEAPVSKRVAQVHAELIGDGASQTYNVDHNLNTLEVVVAVITVATGEAVLVDWTTTTADRVRITFGPGSIPTSNQYRVVVIG